MKTGHWFCFNCNDIQFPSLHQCSGLHKCPMCHKHAMEWISAETVAETKQTPLTTEELADMANAPVRFEPRRATDDFAREQFKQMREATLKEND